MTVPDSLPLPPHDDQLPAVATLLDAEAMATHLGQLFAGRVSGVRIRYIDYAPGVSLTVQYDARAAVDGSPIVEAHATTDRDSWRMWAYPHDPFLPLLAADSRQLTNALGVQPSDSLVTRLAWVPQRRAVLRCGSVVVKLYGDPVERARAERALYRLEGALPTAALIKSRPDHGAVVQQALGGRPLHRDDAVRGAGGAAAILQKLHHSALVGLDDLRPPKLLAAADRPAALAAFAVPGLLERIRVLIDQLAATMPDAAVVVPVHGDFNVGQLLVDGDRTWVVDVDTLSEGSPSVDLAAYAANLHNGRSADDDHVRAALAGLRQAYGPSPSDLTWHLAATMLRRVDRPIRRLKKRWPQRTEAIVSAIERMLR